MTTYSFKGFLMQWEDTNGDGNDNKLTLGETKLKMVARDNQGSFTYDVNPDPKDNGDLPEVTLIGFEPYTIKLNGQGFDGENSETSIGEIHWGSGNVTQLLSFGSNGTDHLFVVGGMELPTFNKKADVRAFEKTATYFGEVTSGPLREGVELHVGNLDGVSISENDKIVGTSANEVYKGGIGKDKIFSNGGDDRIFGGKGKDLLDGGRGQDLLVGGANEDIFLFRNKYGKDTIRDFTDDVDTLKLDDSLWAKDFTKKQVLKKFASIVDGDLVLDFGKHELTLKDFDNTDALLNDLVII